MNATEANLEDEARALRNIVYVHAIGRKGWASCKDNWIRDIEWLRQRAGVILAKNNIRNWLIWGVDKEQQ